MAAESANSSLLRENVVAIIVSRGDDDDYLYQTLSAVIEQTWEPQHIVLVRPSSIIHSRSDLAELVKESGVTTVLAKDAHNFGDNITQALAEIDMHHTKDSSARTWLWLLHADSAPNVDALDILLRKGETSNRIGALGPKQISWDSEFDGTRTLLEVGIRATRSARRVPEIDPNERDQGQHDSREDVLGIGTAGMLLRADLYFQLGGFNPDLGPFGDGLEFSRRVRSAGYRVVVVPSAQIRHARLSLGHFPQEGDNLAPSFGDRRRAQLYNSLLTMAPGLFVFAWLGYILGAIPRSLIRLVWRDTGRAKGELKAGWLTALSIGAVLRGRQAIDKAGGTPKGISQLEDSASTIRAVKRETKKSREEALKLFARPDPLTLKAQEDLRLHTRKGLVAAFVTALLFSLLFNIPYLSQGILAGGGILPDQSTASDIWDAARHSWLATGDGYAAPIDSLWLMYLPFLFLGSPFGITLGQLLTVTLYATYPIAAIGAYLAAGRFTKTWLVRYIAALLWIVAPSLLEGHVTGQISVVIVHTLLPFVLWALVGARSRKPGYMGLAALLSAALCAASPVMILPVLIVMVVGLLTEKRLLWLWLPVPALVALLPLFRVVSSNASYWLAALFSTPNLPYAESIQTRDVLGGFITRDFSGSSWDKLLFGALLVILVVAVLALLRNRHWGTIRVAWATIVVGIGLAFIAIRIPISQANTPNGIVSVNAWPGTAMSLAWLGIFVAIVAGSHSLKTTLRQRSFGLSQIFGFISMLGIPLAIIAIAGQWTHLQMTASDPVLRSASEQVVPALAQNNRVSDERSRVLALSPEPTGLHAEIWRSEGLQMHEIPIARGISGIGGKPDPIFRHTASSEGPDLDDAATIDLSQIVANMTSGSKTVSTQLAEHAVSVVLVPPASSSHTIQSERTKLISYLNAVPGLERVTENETGEFWRVANTDDAKVSSAAVKLISNDDGSVKKVPARPYGAQTNIAVEKPSTLVIAERASSGWKAEVDGVALKTKDHDWAQAWSVPAGTTGELRIYHDDPWSTVILIAQIVIALIGFVTALPLRPDRGSAE
ncbi:glycosyltransferase [Arcanobacterium ihumii]|uniref:glycosyltransferase n=1 Tax=Arcanobacterium ihumii TaxID=2138162 RepID=UPI0013591B62|nr:glycosyltransferase [Arcanobacterium ihumii]